ncbi:MAG: hypothetical protein NC934_07465, partial [Candidatus Omnitrophica bacterium]|nr:hypothetical protein [Candidatus Omnitrophota bacterium]
VEILEKEIRETKKAMDEAQEEANSHKGAMESRYDTFKEEAQYKAGAYAKKLVQLNQQLSQVQLIKPTILNSAQFGALVESENKTYFLIGYFGPEPIRLDEKEIFPISISSPIGKLFINKKPGDEIHLNDKIIRIKNVF